MTYTPERLTFMLQALIELDRDQRLAEIRLCTRVTVFALAFAGVCFASLYFVGG